MFGISSVELLMILVIGVVVLGPERLPQVVRTVTKWMSQFRRISTELQRTINTEAHLLEHNALKKKAENELFGKPKKKKKPVAAEPENKADSAPSGEAPPEVPPSPELVEAGIADSPARAETQQTAPQQPSETSAPEASAPAEENKA